MGCNSGSCGKYSPQENPQLGIQMEKAQFPYPNTKRINAPTWERDRVMYDFEDVCTSVAAASRYSTNSTSTTTTTPAPPGSPPGTPGTSTTTNVPGFGYMSINNAGANAGKLFQTLTNTNWWETYRQCTTPVTFGQYAGAIQKVRYWDHYPSQLSFEPIFSDTWFYYKFDTLNGVTGTPCHTYCFTVTYYNTAGADGGSSRQINYVYNVIKTPFVCPCTPDETYIRYTLEDGLTNPSYNSDPYPTFWSVGTKRNGIAFRYNVGAAGNMLYYQPRDGQERYPLYRNNAPTGEKVWTRWGVRMFGKVSASNAKPAGFTSTQNVTFSNGMVLNMTFECHRGSYGNRSIGGNANTFVKLNSIVSGPTGGWPSSGNPIKVSLNPVSAFSNTTITENIMGWIWIYPPGSSRNPNNKSVGVPTDFMLSESRFEGGLYAVTNPQAGQWSTWFNTYAVWTNDVQNNLVGREMTIVMRKIPVSQAGTYTLEMAIDDGGSFILESWGRQRQEDDEVLADADEGREIAVTAGFNGGTTTTTFTVSSAGYINITANVTNTGTNTNWSSNPGGFAAVLKRGSTTVWTTRDQVNQTSLNGGDAFRGKTLVQAGFVDAWDGVVGIPFRSVGDAAGRCWNGNNIRVLKDYKFPGGLKVRMMLQSEYDSANSRYNTIWRIDRILSYGRGYSAGDGTNYVDQNKFTLYFPNKNDPNRISVTLLISAVSDDSRYVEPTAVKLQEGTSVNGHTIVDVKESNDELNMHYAELRGGTADFVKDQVYTASNGSSIQVIAGYGIKDRAVLIGLYEFRKKEIEFGVGLPTEGLPFSPELIRPRVSAQITNGRVSGIQIIGKGRGLQSKNVAEPKLVVEPPPTYFNSDLYDTMLQKGFSVDKSRRAAKGTGTIAQLKPFYEGGRLTRVEILDGGSGYSESNPPNVFVPYIARVDQQQVKPQQSIDEMEYGAKMMFEKSEAFKNIASKSYDKANFSIDSKTGDASITGSSKASGFNWKDYSDMQAGNYGEVSYPLTKTDVQAMTSASTKRTARYETRGIDKSTAQTFKTGSKNTKDNKAVKEVTSKTSAKIQPGKLSQNVSSVTKLSTGKEVTVGSVNLDYNKYLGSTPSGQQALNQAQALPTVNSNNAIKKGQLTSNDNASSLNYKTGTSADAFTTKYAGQVSGQIKNSNGGYQNKATSLSSSKGNFNYANEFKDFTRKLGSGNPTDKSLQFSKMDWSSTAGGGKATIPKDFKGIQSKKDYSNSVPTILDTQEQQANANLDEMWQRDEESNRIGSWYNTEMRVVKQSFFNLPCRNNKEIYLMRRFCPDPRPWTNINIRLGVIKNPVDPNDPEKTHCKKCLEDQPSLKTLRSQLRSQFGDNTLDIEDAYCVSIYGLPTALWYSGIGAGAGATGTTYAVPFGAKDIYASSTFKMTAKGPTGLRSMTGYQQQNTQTEDGCRSYEINGNLLIYHSLTNEARLWADSVGSYGNPYDFMCDRSYGDQGEEDLYSTEDAGNDENDDAALMPGYRIVSINGSQYNTGQSLTVPEEGY